jgi:hypothetical protein
VAAKPIAATPRHKTTRGLQEPGNEMVFSSTPQQVSQGIILTNNVKPF